VVRRAVPTVLVPGGCLFDGYDRTDFMLRSTAVDNPSETTVVLFREKGGTGDGAVVPACDTNRRGFTRFAARKPGEYRLADRGRPLDDLSGLAPETQQAVRFAVARGLLAEAEAGRFCPDAPVSDTAWRAAVDSLAEYGIDLKNQAKPATRAEAAVVLRTAVQTLLESAIESPYTNAYLTRDRIRIGAWVNPRGGAVGEDFIKTYSSAVLTGSSPTGRWRGR
jgi:hypothetical protein